MNKTNTEAKTRGRKKGCQKSKHLRIIQDDELFPHYRSYGQHKNQALWRGEDYQLLFNEWVDAYGLEINNRGRKKGNAMMLRVDASLPWRPNNVRIIIVGEEPRVLN
jgi:hypothetical protein